LMLAGMSVCVIEIELGLFHKPLVAYLFALCCF
jgi:hypothetical protein